jgi:Restriction endonuclease
MKQPHPLRVDRQGAHRVAFEKNRKRILKTQNTCSICGKPVDKNIKAPAPMSAVIDHIIPINKGGHPSAIENLQLAHWTCNRQKSDKLFNAPKEEPKVLGNRNLPQSIEWIKYKGK